MPVVVSLIGRSYCGSTLVNLLLSAHPRIFGGGELHRLGLANRRPVCPICGAGCAFWTEAFLERQHAAFDYAAIAARAGRDVLVDASKTTAWFASIAGARAGHDLVDICLTKHPMRHVSSFVDNQYYRDNEVHAQINAAGGDLTKVELDLDALGAYAVETAQSLLGTYERATQPFAPSERAPEILRYEDVVSDRRRALAPVLAQAGLDYHPAMDAYEEEAHHGLGGNAGAYSVVRRTVDAEGQAKRWAQQIKAAKLSVFRHQYYDGVADVALDDKYLRVLPEKVRSALMGSAPYQALCDLLGYPHDPAAAKAPKRPADAPPEGPPRTTAIEQASCAATRARRPAARVPTERQYTFSAATDVQGDVRQRRFPAPYRAMLAISSDIDRTSIHGLREMPRFINTEAETAGGPGVGLDFANSMWMYGSTGGSAQYAKVLARDDSYWRSPNDCAAPSPVADELVEYARSGWIDTLHTYGNFSQVSDMVPFTRDLAEAALAELDARGVALTVWTNHGGRSNAQNIGPKRFMHGDNPKSPAYHADLLRAYGARFLHVANEPSRFGHADILSTTTLRDGGHMHAWPRFSSIVGNRAAAVRADSMNGLARLGGGDDDYANIWFSGTLGEQLNRRVLDSLVSDNLYAILAQHLGTVTPMAGLDAPARDALRLLRSYQDAGRILVSRTSRLLRYAANRQAAHWAVIGADDGPIVDVVSLRDVVDGPRTPTLEDLRGLTFEAPARQRLRIAIAGRLVDETEVFRTVEGGLATAGVRWHPPDTTDRSTDFRQANRHTSVSGYPLAREARMQLGRLNDMALSWLDDVAAPALADAEPARKAAHAYVRGRYGVGLEHYGGVMERLGFTGRGAGLDVGSGAGHWVAAYAALNGSAVGLDVRADYVGLANGVSEAVGLGEVARSIVGDGRRLPFDENAFDAVWSHGVLMLVEHDRMLAEMNRVLSATGAMYLAYNSLGQRLQMLARDDVKSARVRIGALDIVFNTGLYKFGIYRTLGGRVRAYTREELQQTARYCGFETLGAPGVQDSGRRWGDIETTIDLIARKRLGQPLLVKDLARRAADDAAIVLEARKALNFGAPEAAMRLLEVADVQEGPPDARVAYLEASLKAGQIETPEHPGLAALRDLDTEDAARLLAKAAFNFGRWTEALEWLDRTPRDRETAYLTVAAQINSELFEEAIASAEAALARDDRDLFSNIGLLKALEAAGEDERFHADTTALAQRLSNGDVEVATF